MEASLRLRQRFKNKADVIKLSNAIVTFSMVQLTMVVTMVMFGPQHGMRGPVSLAVLIGGVGAVISMIGALALKKAIKQNNEQLELLKNMEQFNDVLRAQRHDFSNHIQVVSALLEMEEYDEAKAYLGKVTADIKSTNAALKTAQPAVNALLKAKQLLCEERGIAFEIDIKDKLETLPVESWELCRVLANLIDNAAEAIGENADGKYIHVSIYDWQGQLNIVVANNGPEIPDSDIPCLFLPNFTTKGPERGMGLGIVMAIAESCGGEVSAGSSELETSFLVQLSRGEQKTDI